MAVQRKFGDMVRSIQDSPEFRQIASRVGDEKVLGMLNSTAEISEACKRLPQVVNHNDLHARNMFIDIDDSGNRTSYAIDWASVGIGLIGLDGGTLAGGEIGWKEHQAIQLAEIEGQMFESYMEGLKESEFDNYYPLDSSEGVRSQPV